MSQRGPPSNPSGNRYIPRDRSLPRFQDGRGPIQHSGPLAARITDPPYGVPAPRGYSNAGTGASHREPPKGPRALTDGPPRGGGFVSRGRGFGHRLDTRERDLRDSRDPPAVGRSAGHDWSWQSQLASRERRPSPKGRDRSRSPHSRGPRDLRPTDLDIERARRNSRDGPPTVGYIGSEGPAPGGYRGRGGFRARGRGEWDSGCHGRTIYQDGQESVRPRSWSRDENWNRDGQIERERERVREIYRREDDSRKGWDDRDFEKQKRELPPFRPDSRNSTGAQATPSTPQSISTSSSNHNPDRGSYRPRASSIEPSRRASSSLIPQGLPPNLRDPERRDSNPWRPDITKDRQLTRQDSPPPQAPQVPAFGSIALPPISTSSRIVDGKSGSQGGVSYTTAAPRPIAAIAPKPTPIAPKADLASRPPTGPKAEQDAGRRPNQELTSAGAYGFDAEKGRHGPARNPSLAAGSVYHTTCGRDHQSHVSQTATSYTAPSHFSNKPETKSIARPSSLVLQQPPQRRSSEIQTSKEYGPSPPSALSSRQITSGSSMHISPSRIPTGPRAGRSVSSNRQAIPTPTRPAIIKATPQTYPNKNSLQWINPNAPIRVPPYVPKGPSIMNTLPTKRDYIGDDGIRAFKADQKRNDYENISLDPADDEAKSTSAGYVVDDSQDGGGPSEEPAGKAEESTTELAPESTTSPSSEAPGVDAVAPDEIQKVTRDDHTIPEDEADLDEEDFIEAERKFERQKRSLEARKLGNPRHYAMVTSLLEEINALEIAAEELSSAKRIGGQDTHDKQTTRGIASGLLSPKPEEQDQIAFPDVPMIEPETPSIESLPFLVSGPPTPFSELDFWQEQVESHDAIKDQIVESLVNLNDHYLLDHEKLTSQYIRFYKPWRLKNAELDAENHVPVMSISPVLAASPVISMVTPIPITEGRRAGKFQSELDVQRLIAETAQVAQHERERQDREARALLNTAKEAVIPDMLTSVEKSISLYQDFNQLVDRHHVIKVFGFVPAPDNFSEEEQKVFCEQYAMCPKKWGKLAEALPGRDYQDCIRHYYLTKADGKYKRLPKGGMRKGRKGMRMQGRPKSAAFMSVPGVRANSYGSNETVNTVIAMTETGRPRRAAAPTFGDVIAVELEPAPLIQTPGRRNTISARVEPPGDPKANAEKPPVKRGRNAQAKEKGTRKGKATTLLAPAPGPSPLKNESLGIRGKSKEPKPNEVPEESKIEDDQHLTNINQGIVIPTSQIEGWLGDQRNTLIGTVQFPKPQQAGQEQQQQRTTGPTSSYWSVPEQQDFIKLLGYFGTDWQAISTQMKTKTHIMVKNYYFRSLEGGKSEFEQVGLNADARIRRGEDMGPPPAPTPIQKRKYETTPQMVPHRPLAPSIESMEIEDDSPSLHAATISHTSSPQFSQQPPRFPSLSQSSTKTTSFALDLPTSGGVELSVRPMAPTQQNRTPQPLQGPRAGYFNEERKENRPIPQAHSVQHFPEQVEHQRQLTDMQIAKDFQEKLSRQHKGRQQAQEVERAPSRQRKSAQSQQSTATQQYISDTRANVNSQVRIAPLHATDAEKRPRSNSQQQRQQAEAMPFPRRIDTYVQNPHSSTPLQSPASARPAQSIASPAEGPRPSSVPATASIHPPPRRPPVPARKIDIMSLVNDEHAEPQPHKRLSDTRIIAPAQQIPSPSTLSQVYQQPSAPPPQMQRREMPHETSLHMQQQDLRSSFGPPMQLQPQPPSGTWPGVPQRTYFSEQTPYPSPSMQSPPIQPNFPPPSSRSTFATLQQRPHAPSPPPPPYPSHSRHSSYTSMAPHPHQQQTQPHGASSLQASPYARIQPQTQQHIQPQPPPQQAPQSQHAYMSSHIPSPRDEYLRRQEALMMQEMSSPYEQTNALSHRESLKREMSRPDAMDRKGRFTPTGFGSRQGQGRER